MESICGDDLNSRIGFRNDCILRDENLSFTYDVDYVPDTPLLRASSDSVCNRFGIKLLDWCKSTCLGILNGRLGDDHGVCAYTYISHQDASVIDYVLAKERDFTRVCNFDIGKLTEWSDHAPVKLSLPVT